MSSEIKYWLGLGQVKGVGNVTYKTLIDEFHDPETVFEAPLKRLEEIPGIGKKTAANIKSFKEWDWVEKEIGLIKKHDVVFLTQRHSDFPKALLSISDPPPYLYVKGTICKKDENAIAVVGTRIPTQYGISAAEGISRELAGSGITIVSGMARGIDTAAHRGALAANGRTIAVLGSGIDVIYPSDNKKLYEQIISNGAVVSEFPIGMSPLAENFPQRNRIISGLVKGVLVVEASEKSGSLITAGLALDYGRDVFALPGNITSFKSKGANKLIKQGAKLVEDARDILEELSISGTGMTGAGLKPVPAVPDSLRKIQAGLSSEEEKIMSLLDEPSFIDTIIQRAGLPTQKVSALLLDMELKGLVQQQAGKQFIRRGG
ncbi:MAG TPA: DNA-processing protein DprA [Thermodesulfobacteriota bacterium]|nr:DNA-processing protein DprA [Thermodesulfobacteriota bacterium]